MVLGILKLALHLRDRHVFMWQSVEILNNFNTLTLKQTFWKRKTFFKNLDYCFLVESTIRLKTHYFYTKLLYQKPMLRQIEWWMQNGPIIKNEILPVTILFFERNFIFLIKSLFDVSTTQMPIFLLFVNAGVLFDSAFSLWVSIT